MAIENNGPEAAYPGPAEPDTGEGHGSGIEQAKSEPKQGADESEAQKRPDDWNPPPDTPGSDQDAVTNRDNNRDNGNTKTDSLIDAE